MELKNMPKGQMKQTTKSQLGLELHHLTFCIKELAEKVFSGQITDIEELKGDIFLLTQANLNQKERQYNITVYESLLKQKLSDKFLFSLI